VLSHASGFFVKNTLNSPVPPSGTIGWDGSENTKARKIYSFLKIFVACFLNVNFAVFGCPAKQDFRWLACGEQAIRGLPDFPENRFGF